MKKKFRIKCENIEEFNLVQKILNSKGYLWNSLNDSIIYKKSFPVIILDATAVSEKRLSFNSVNTTDFNIRAISFIRKQKINNIG